MNKKVSHLLSFREPWVELQEKNNKHKSTETINKQINNTQTTTQGSGVNRDSEERTIMDKSKLEVFIVLRRKVPLFL